MKEPAFHPVYRSINRPLTILGAERRLFFLALAVGGGAFNLFGSLLTGLLMSLGTSWGLFRHYWVLVKLILTILVIAVLLLQMGGIAHVARLAADGSLPAGELRGLRSSFIVHAGGGLLVLLFLSAISIWKPRGLTRHGWRKVNEQQAS